MQSPNEIQPITEPLPDYQTRALGCLFWIGVALAIPLIAALLFYLMTVAAQNYWALVGAVKGGL